MSDSRIDSPFGKFSPGVSGHTSIEPVVIVAITFAVRTMNKAVCFRVDIWIMYACSELYKQNGVPISHYGISVIPLFDFNLGIMPENIESDIPAIQEALADHPMSVMYGTYMLFIGAGFAIISVLSKLVSSIFVLIEKENTPFTGKVKKRVAITMIVTTAILFLTTGTPFGVLFALLTWVVYAILDYGITLQTQSDETL